MSEDMKCVVCSRSLDERPCIFVESEPYCFKDAKQAVRGLEKERNESAKANYQEKLREYEASKAEFQTRMAEWRRRKDSAVPVHGRLFSATMGQFTRTFS